jgi:hypothetical protein
MAIALIGAPIATHGRTCDTTAANSPATHTANAGSGANLRTAIGPTITTVATTESHRGSAGLLGVVASTAA